MKQENTNYLTLLSVLSAIAVVCLHTNGCFWTFSREPYWITANIIESVFYFAVPVFFMISGATLIDYPQRYSTMTFFKKRIHKTLLPFFIWSIVGLFYQLVIQKRISPESVNISFLLDGILNAKIIGVYWFFPALFCVYLCIPLFASVDRTKRKEAFGYLLFVGLLCNIGIPFLKTIFHVEITWPVSVSVVSGYLFYIILGVYLSQFSPTKKIEYFIYLCALLGLSMHILGTQITSFREGAIVSTWKGYNNLPCILYSAGIFLFFVKNGNRFMNGRFGSIVKSMSKYTFAIYLMHYYIMDTLRIYLFERYLHILPTSLIYRLGAPVIIIFISIGITKIIRKIHVFRWILPC